MTAGCALSCEESVDDVAVILMTGWLTPWRLGDAARFMSAKWQHHHTISWRLRELFLVMHQMQYAF